jgi:apolipoprotein N-acyltransferase
MTPHANTDAASRPPAFPAVLYRWYWRALVGALAAISGAALLAILVAVLFVPEGPHNPLRLMRLVAASCLLPGLAVVVLRWAFATTVRVDADTLVLEQRDRRTEIPVASIVAVEPWKLPLPGSGVRLRLRSGRRWSDGIQMDDPAALIDALTDAGAPAELRRLTQHPAMVYARARPKPPSATRRLLKFPVFALVPTLPLFRVHQLIAYGGVFGEYYQYGLEAYVLAFAIYWATLTIYLMLYAAALRVPLELAAMAAAAVAPEYARGVRGILERIAAILFYAGVPVLVILRFIPW